MTASKPKRRSQNTLTPNEFDTQIYSGPLAPVYLFLGEEDFFLDSCIRTLKEKIFGPTEDIFNYNLIFGDDKEVDAEEILTLCKTLPLFSPQRLVIVKRIDKLRANSLEAIQDYVQNPLSSTCLALAGTKLDGRSKAAQVLKKHSSLVDCKPLETRDIPDEILKYSEKVSMHLDPQSTALLTNACGNNLYTIKHEIDKLATYLLPKTEAKISDVRELITAEPSDSVFEIFNAIVRRDLASALRVVSRFLEEGEPPLRILGLLTSEFRKFWTIKSLTEGTTGTRPSPDTLAKTSGLHPFKIKILLGQINKISIDELQMAFSEMVKADARLKGLGSRKVKDHPMVIEALIISLCLRKASI